VIYEVNAFGNRTRKLVSRDALQPGPAQIVLSVQPDVGTGTQNYRPGTATLQINGISEGKTRFANLVGKQHGETFDIGKDLGTAVSTDYQVPDPFNGVVQQVKVELK
jgi:arylsulfatase